MIDLHTHSSASDGSLSPAELVRQAHAQGIRLLALTDHDTLSGIAAAQSAAQDCGLRLIPGVEISVSWQNKVVHVLGLNVSPDTPALQQGLAFLAEQREQRAQKMAQDLEKRGLEGVYAAVKALAQGQAPGRVHFARYLVQQGKVRDLRKAFKHYLVRGKPGYVAIQWATLSEAVEWICQAGGLAVIAHPARYKVSRTQLKRLLAEFKTLGGHGLEVVSGSHSRDDNFQMARLAAHFGLLSSAGSDYHGPAHPWQKLGQLPTLPAECRAVWEAF